MQDHASAPESAKALKRVLREAFPATTFSVKLSRGTGYGYCHVSWTDGPTVGVVDAVCAPFEGEGFDGMTDSSYSKFGTLPDGRATGLRGILTGRKISAALARRCVAQIAAYWGVDPVEVTEGPCGFQVEAGHRRIREDVSHDWDSSIFRVAGDRTLYQSVR